MRFVDRFSLPELFGGLSVSMILIRRIDDLPGTKHVSPFGRQGRSMPLLDERGKLFGRVNVVDAMVVVFALAVLVAGAVLVFGDETDPGDESEEPPEATMYVTLTSSRVSSLDFTEGNVTLDGANATVTDVHRTIGSRTFLRVELEGVETEEGFRFDGSTVRNGATVTVYDNRSLAQMAVFERDVAPEFEEATVTVTVEETLRTSVAEGVTPGGEHRVGDSTIATVTDTEASAVNETHSDLLATVELETRLVDGVPYYGTNQMRVGRTIAVETDDYEFSGQVTSRESASNDVS